MFTYECGDLSFHTVSEHPWRLAPYQSLIVLALGIIGVIGTWIAIALYLTGYRTGTYAYHVGDFLFLYFIFRPHSMTYLCL